MTDLIPVPAWLLIFLVVSAPLSMPTWYWLGYLLGRWLGRLF